MISDVFNIDCMEGMKNYPDKFFDLAVVDPPYGIKDDGRNHLGRILKKDGNHISKRDKRNGALIIVKPHGYKLNGMYDDEQPSQEYFNEVQRISKNQIIWGSNYLKFDQKNNSSGRIIWDKVNGESDQSDCEIAWTNKHSSVRMFSFMWSGMLQGKSLNEGRIMQGNVMLREKRIHPNHKPIPLYDWIYKNYLHEGGKVIDTHLGSGSNRIAADKAGNIDFTGFELDKDYYEGQEKRFKNYKQQLTLFK